MNAGTYNVGYLPQLSEQGFRSSRHTLFRLLLPEISSIMYWVRVGRSRYFTLNRAGLSQHPLQTCDMLHRHVSILYRRVTCFTDTSVTGFGVKASSTPLVRVRVRQTT